MDELRSKFRKLILLTLLAFGILTGVYYFFSNYLDFPLDPSNTLVNSSGGKLAVGVVNSPPWIITDGDKIEGPEAEIVTDFAESINADVVWVEGSETVLVEKLKNGQIQLIIGGFKDDSIWKEEISFTAPYYAHKVIGVHKGENAFLYKLEEFIYKNKQKIQSIAAESVDQ